MAITSIEWTDFSINPIRARDKETKATGHYCEKISSGCAACYASRLQSRFKMPGFHGLKGNLENVDLYFHTPATGQVLGRQKPTKWFWCDMTDIFGHWVPDEWIDRCFATMALTPQHVHQVLTKRPERMARYLAGLTLERLRIAATSELCYKYGPVLSSRLDAWKERVRQDVDAVIKKLPLPNVWLGTSTENQEQADARIPHLLKCPAAVRFLSCEPLLGPIGLHRTDAKGFGGAEGHKLDCMRKGFWSEKHGFVNHSDMHDEFGPLHWVIVGGESGPRSRPMALGWAKDLVRQCGGAQVPVFVKQLGDNPTNREGEPCPHIRAAKGKDMEEWPAELRVRQFPEVVR